MKQLQKRKWHTFWALLLAVALVFSNAPANVTESYAAESITYYAMIDGIPYDITKEQYDNLYYYCMELCDFDVFYEYLTGCLGDRMPDTWESISIGHTEPSIPDSTPTPTQEPTQEPMPTIEPTNTPMPSAVPGPTEEPVIDDNPYGVDDEFWIEDGVLLQYNGSGGIVTIPSAVKSISMSAFHNNKKIKAVYIPDTVKELSYSVFSECTSLKYVVIPASVKKIQKSAFYNCKKLINIVAKKGSVGYQFAVDNGIAVVTDDKVCFSEKKVVLLDGDVVKNPLCNTISKVKWKSGKKSVVTVSSAGKLKAKKVGKAKITATVKGKKYSFQVVVKKVTESARIKQVIKTVIKPGMSRFQKVKEIHNWMIRNIRYDYQNYLKGRVPMISHTSKGALLKKVAVCDGYSYAFQKFMKKLKIPCKIVIGLGNGGGHAWNMVKVDGKWYHVDVTFDDPIVNGSSNNKTPYYSYFMKSSKAMKKDHWWMVDRYPKCKSKKYDKY